MKKPPPDTGRMEGGSLYQKKKELTKERRQREHPVRESKRAQKRKQRKCFWIWPWGHIYKGSHYDGNRRCAVCDKPAPSDGGW